jgi:CBS domain-containing protein
MGIENVLHQTKIRHLNWAPVICVESHHSLREVLASMQSSRVGCVLITENQKLVGIFTERDVITRIVGDNLDHSRVIREFMTPHPKTLHPEDSFATALQLMDKGCYRDIPLVDHEGRLLGRLSVKNIIDFLTEHYPQEVFSLSPHPRQNFAEPDGA